MIEIDNYEDLINYLNKSMINQNNLLINNNQEKICLLSFNLLHNMGIELISFSIEQAKKNNNNSLKFIANCTDCLPYTLFCMENKFEYILFNNKDIFTKLKKVKNYQNVVFFEDKEKIIEYFKNNV